MHRRRSAYTLRDTDELNRPGLGKNDTIPDETDNADTPPVKLDTSETYEAQTSPRVISWLVTEVKRLGRLIP